MRTTEEALKSVPDSYREGSFGLGAGKLRTVFVVILPSAIPGILAGVILAIGRITGETAALIYTAGTVPGIPTTKLSGIPIFDMMASGRTLAIHMYALLNEGLYTEQAYATAVVLLVMVLLINALSAFVAKKFTRSWKRIMGKFNISKLDLYYDDFHALKNINLDIPEKEITAFIGPSGCGKSTLLKSLNRMNDLVEGCKITGEVTLDGVDIYKNMDVTLLQQKSRYGIPEAQSVSDEHLR